MIILINSHLLYCFLHQVGRSKQQIDSSHEAETIEGTVGDRQCRDIAFLFVFFAFTGGMVRIMTRMYRLFICYNCAHCVALNRIGQHPLVLPFDSQRKLTQFLVSFLCKSYNVVSVSYLYLESVYFEN